jgi:site-specific DNA-methyltransferase (adenine-specific)
VSAKSNKASMVNTVNTVHLSDRCTIILGDCRKVNLPKYDAVISDPPYGINFNHSGHGKGVSKKRNCKRIHDDATPFDASFIFSLAGKLSSRSREKALAVLGADHFPYDVPFRGSFFTWDKSLGCGPCTNFCDAEYGWANVKNPRNIFRHMWMGLLREGLDSSAKSNRVHVSQKPVELMAWMMDFARVKIGATVLDPYMGSGSTGVAALQTGRRFIGVEIDQENFDIAARRLAEAHQRLGIPLHNPVTTP